MYKVIVIKWKEILIVCLVLIRGSRVSLIKSLGIKIMLEVRRMLWMVKEMLLLVLEMLYHLWVNNKWKNCLKNDFDFKKFFTFLILMKV